MKKICSFLYHVLLILLMIKGIFAILDSLKIPDILKKPKDEEFDLPDPEDFDEATEDVEDLFDDTDDDLDFLE